ncbi:sodium:solute symporter family protein [Methanothrix sp.]|uniref:sodium:solute symporter family protein n=1 Tax=Methanothrix sp. TaxID=90426 RepID=UPI00316ACB45
MRGLVDFHLAGRRQGIMALTGTFCATILGASTTIGMAGLGYSQGLTGSWWMLSGTIGMLILSLFLAERIRSTGCSTLPQLVGSFYGERAQASASLLIAISWIGVIAMQIIASGNILSAVFGGDINYYMIVSSMVFVLYTAYGGRISVIRTDLFQLLIITSGLAILFWRAFSTVGAGPLIGQSFPLSAEMDFWKAISMILVVGSAYLIGPDMYSIIFSSRSARGAKLSAFMTAIILIPLAFLITSLGIFSRHLYPAISPEQAVPSLMAGLLSPAVEGLVAAALLAAFMSSADTCLMTFTTILTFDIYGKIRQRAHRESSLKDDQDHMMKASRVAVIIAGVFALTFAVFIPNIIKALLIAYTVFTSGLFIPIIAGFYRKKLGLTSTGALWAIAGGGSTAILLGQSYPLLGMAVSAALLFAVSWRKRLPL